MVKGSERDGDGDRLLTLPEPILGRILSLLTTDDAVKTSVLSSKWRFKWRLITRLHFDDHKVAQKGTSHWIRSKMYFNFVEKVLLLIGNCTIQEFKICCYYEGYDPEKISLCILAAMMRDARKIIINFYEAVSVDFPSLTNCCAIIEELLLHMTCTIQINVSSIGFPCLRVMCLSAVTIITSLREFNFRFNVLEYLRLVNCEWKNSDTLNIFAPELITFSINDHIDLYYEENGTGDTCKFSIILTVPKLTSFDSSGNTVPNITLLGTSAVVDLSVETPFSVSYRDRVSRRCVRLLQEFSNAKHLKISSHIITKDGLPKFNNLVKLEVESGVFDENLTALLHRAPVLKSLIFSQYPEQNEDAEITGMFPRSVLSSLKVVEFRDSQGTEKEWLELAKFLLKNAIALEKMIIKCSISFYEENEKLIQQLVECPRCSSCAIIVHAKASN